MIVQTYKFGEPGVEMAVDLLGDGTVALYFQGQIRTICETHGKPVMHKIEHGEIQCSSDMAEPDMTDVEAIIRGDAAVAETFGMKMIDLIATQISVDPCQTGADQEPG